MKPGSTKERLVVAAGKKLKGYGVEGPLHGKLNVQVLSARNLAKVEQCGYSEMLKEAMSSYSIKRFGYSNPFCRVKYDGVFQDTCVVYRCTEPEWAYQQFYFDVQLTEAQWRDDWQDNSAVTSSKTLTADPDNGEHLKVFDFSCEELELEVYHQFDDFSSDNSASFFEKKNKTSQKKTSAATDDDSTRGGSSRRGVGDGAEEEKNQGGKEEKRGSGGGGGGAEGWLAWGATWAAASVGYGHSKSQSRDKNIKEGVGPIGAVPIGKTKVDVLELLLGKVGHLYDWFPLYGEDGAPCGEVRLGVGFALSAPPRRGDWVRLLAAGGPDGAALLRFPLSTGLVMEVEDDDPAYTKVMVSYYTPEDWKCQVELHPNSVSIVHRRDLSRYERAEAFMLRTAAAFAESETAQRSWAAARGWAAAGAGWLGWGGGGGGGGDDPRLGGPEEEESKKTREQEGADQPPAPGTIELPVCPITTMPMTDPVCAADGHTYEREAIERWLREHDTSPITGQVLPTKSLFKNYSLLSSIEALAAHQQQKHKSHWQDQQRQKKMEEDKSKAEVLPSDTKQVAASIGNTQSVTETQSGLEKTKEVREEDCSSEADPESQEDGGVEEEKRNSRGGRSFKST